MSSSRSTIARLLTLVLLFSAASRVIAADAVQGGPQQPATVSSPLVSSFAVQVSISAAQVTESCDSRSPQPEPFDLPLVYLHRNGTATAEAQRTLTIELAGLADGMEVEAEIVSWHEDPSTQMRHRPSHRFVLPDRPCTAHDPCAVRWVLDPATVLSDFYRLELWDSAGHLLWENPEGERPDLVALDTWEVAIDGYAVRIYYATLFPFARGETGLNYRLPPGQVTPFIARQFTPMVLDTWRTQFSAWGFGPIHPSWDADGVVEVFLTCPPFALFGGTGTYTISGYDDGSPYPERRLWLACCDNTLQGYDTLENGYKVLLAHEFFHLVQWNILLRAGCPAQHWRNTFIEAQGKFAASVQYPELEMSRDHLFYDNSEYSGAAQRFLSSRLRASMAALEAEEADRYDAALYWRFLYERTGSMRVIRAALEEVACRSEAESPAALDKVMDAALARSGGPIQGFEQSRVALAQAIYALRLEGGRRTTADPGTCNGRLYDPDGLYTPPTLQAELHYDGAPLTYGGSIPTSYGIDLIEVQLDPELGERPVTVVLRSARGRFSVQVWRLVPGREPVNNGARMRALTSQPQALQGDCRTGCQITVPSLDQARADRRRGYSLALIVVRLDSDEQADPVGAYQLIVDAR